VRKGKQSGFRLDLYFNSKLDYGQMIVFIHNRTQMPATVYNKGYFVSAGATNYFSVKRNMVKKLENPYNDCYKNVSHQTSFNKTVIDYFKKKNILFTLKMNVLTCAEI